MTTPRDLITDSLVDLGVISPVDSIDATQVTGLFRRLNQMIAMWSTQSMLIYGDVLVSKTLTAGTSSYSIGTGADINTPRPNVVKTAYVRDADTDTALDIIDEYKYSGIVDKATLAEPDFLYYNPSYPNGFIKLWPVPEKNYTLLLEVEQPLTQFVSIDTAISLPDGYEEAIRFNLMKRIAGGYGKMLTPEQATLAADGLELIKKANRRNDSFEASLPCELTSRGTFDIYTGKYI